MHKGHCKIKPNANKKVGNMIANAMAVFAVGSVGVNATDLTSKLVGNVDKK